MTTQEKAPSANAAVPQAPAPRLQTRKFTVAEYYRMGEVGILGTDERVELINGEIIVMPPIGPGHAGSVDFTADYITRRLDERFIVRSQNPVHLGDGSEPQPDLAVIVRRREGHFTSHPTPTDVLLVIEVADSSLEYDRGVKAHLYGRAGIPETWVKNLPEDCIERFTEPGADGYSRHTVHRRGETLKPVAVPDLELPVDELLPPLPPLPAEQETVRE